MFTENTVFLNQNLKSKEEVLNFLANKAYELGYVVNKQTAINDLNDRENEVSTGLQDGFAIPHCRTENISGIVIFFVSLTKGITWKTFDGKDVNYIFCILVPSSRKDNDQVHLQLISKIAVNLLEDDFKEKIRNASSEKEITELINFEK